LRLRVWGSLLALVAIAGLATVVLHRDRGGAGVEARGALTTSQYNLAVAAARGQVHASDTITAAHATILTRHVEGNLQPCPKPSLRIQLIGTFPDIATGGFAGPGSSAANGPVTSLLITADPTSGSVCQVGVSTGAPHDYPEAANLTAALGQAG
jgi:hypothetical protein